MEKTEIKSADKVIFPGVGEASSAMKSLQENDLHKHSLQLILYCLLRSTLIQHVRYPLKNLQRNFPSYANENRPKGPTCRKGVFDCYMKTKIAAHCLFFSAQN